MSRSLCANAMADPARYMAPEVLSSAVVPASDVWSAGVMAHQLLTGRFPFDDRANRAHPAISKIWRALPAASLTRLSTLVALLMHVFSSTLSRESWRVPVCISPLPVRLVRQFCSMPSDHGRGSHHSSPCSCYLTIEGGGLTAHVACWCEIRL